MKYLRKKQIQNGFTLLELILYMAIVTILMTSLIPFAWNIIEGGVKSATNQEIFTQGQYAADRITYEIRNASDVNYAYPGQISLATTTPATNPTLISLNAGVINIQQGSSPPYAINSQNTSVQSLTFANYSSSDGKTKNVHFAFTIKANYSGAGTRQEYNGSVAMDGTAEVRSNQGVAAAPTPTPEWYVSSSTYTGKSKLVSASDVGPMSLRFSADGTKMYFAGDSSSKIYQYSLSTAWDVSTANPTSSYNPTAQTGSTGNAVSGVSFSSDGTKMYVSGAQNQKIYEYTLSTAWNITTATYASKSLSVNIGGLESGTAFNTTGTAFYVTTEGGKAIYEYPLSTAWDISTAGASTNIDLSAQSSQPTDVAFSADGSIMLVTDNNITGTIYQYGLSTNWDVTTATYSNVKYTVLQDGNPSDPMGIFLNPTNTLMYLVGWNTTTVYEYNL